MLMRVDSWEGLGERGSLEMRNGHLALGSATHPCYSWFYHGDLRFYCNKVHLGPDQWISWNWKEYNWCSEIYIRSYSRNTTAASIVISFYEQTHLQVTPFVCCIQKHRKTTGKELPVIKPFNTIKSAFRKNKNPSSHNGQSEERKIPWRAKENSK